MVEMRERRKLLERKEKFPAEEVKEVKKEEEVEDVEEEIDEEIEISKTIGEIKRERIERADVEGRIIKSCPTIPTIELRFDRRKPREERFKRVTRLI